MHLGHKKKKKRNEENWITESCCYSIIINNSVFPNHFLCFCLLSFIHWITNNADIGTSK